MITKSQDWDAALKLEADRREQAEADRDAAREELAQAMQIIRGEGIGESLLAAEQEAERLRGAIEEHRTQKLHGSLADDDFADDKLYAALQPPDGTEENDGS